MALDTSTTLSNGTEIRARSVGSMDNIAYLITPMGGRSVLIDAAWAELAVRALHAAYGLDQI